MEAGDFPEDATTLNDDGSDELETHLHWEEECLCGLLFLNAVHSLPLEPPLLKHPENPIIPMTMERPIETESQFLVRIAQEWRRAERSGRPALLILFRGIRDAEPGEGLIRRIGSVVRDTDVVGWFQADVILGVICLELGNTEIGSARSILLDKIALHVFGGMYPPGVVVTAHILPPYTGSGPLNGEDAEFAQALLRRVVSDSWSARLGRATRRAIDILVSSILLVTLSPLLTVIAICVRLTSPGPAIFQQLRTGMGGRPFKFYKFRTMKDAADPSLHHEYVSRFIHGNAEKHLDGRGRPIYKLTMDPRITRLGRWLRCTSFDELPQLWNVLRGDMTLVGPRPALPYEVECYAMWHRRRVFELKPGLTGLWQVRGRSHCSFDEMVRLDLQHGRESLGLYLRVLLETPQAVFTRGGAQ